MEKGFCTIKLSEIKKAEFNYKVDDDWMSEKLTNNIIRNGVIENIIVREIDNGKYEVVNGNHRLDVLNKLKINDVFCYNLGKISKTEAERIAVETNETRFGTDKDKLSILIDNLKAEFNIDDLIKTIPIHIEDIKIDNLEIDDDKDEDSIYTKKIEVPIYEPKNEKPIPEDLYDIEKYNEMLIDIKNSDIAEQDKKFLTLAATRHIMFHYDKIADYYAHSEKNTQELMERLALVIIDFNKAIEYGYINIEKKLIDLYESGKKNE